jgi:hypothetical protein
MPLRHLSACLLLCGVAAHAQSQTPAKPVAEAAGIETTWAK